MSFLAEVLNNAEKVEIETFNKEVPKIIENITTLKVQVIEYIDKVYKFSSKPEQTTLLSKASDVSGKMNTLKTNVEQLKHKSIGTVTQQLSQYSVELSEVDVTLNLVLQVLEIHESLMKAKTLESEKLYVDAIQLVGDMLKKIQRIPEHDAVEAILELENNVKKENMLLVHKLNQICQDNIVCMKAKKGDVQIAVMKLKKMNDDMNQALIALFYHNSTISSLSKVTKFLWNEVFTPIVNCNAEVTLGQEDDMQTLEVLVRDHDKKVFYLEVFANLEKVINYLSLNFNYRLQDGSSNIHISGTTNIPVRRTTNSPISGNINSAAGDTNGTISSTTGGATNVTIPNTTSLSYIGNDIKDNLSELLIKNCLSDTIPSSSEGLQQYNKVIKDTEDLQKKLIESSIFQEGTTSLLDYASNIDILFINKKCKDYLLLADNIMKKDLHDTVEVGKPHDPANPLSELIRNDFPLSCISSSAIELLELAEKIMQSAVASQDVSAGRLYCTVQKVFEIYGKVVTEHHKKLLQTIPQQVAIFYNNCQYVAYKLGQWSDKYQQQLSGIVKAGLKCSFKDQATTLQKLGSQYFQDCVEAQIKQIEEILKGSGLCNTQSFEKLTEITEKSIRQCLRQQELLKTVWLKVLPYAIYNKTLGRILNAMCNFIINAVVKVEDISSEAGEQLVDMCKLVLTRGPKLFSDPNEITLYVENWNKMQELVLVLNSSLIEISERWADGKGPLALQFNAEELKQLIRAIFQNSDRRAAVLSKIR